MATTEYSLFVKPMFADGSTRSTITIGNYAHSYGTALANAKVRVKALNADPSAIADLYLSDKGAAFSGIESAGVIALTRTEVFNKEGA